MAKKVKGSARTAQKFGRVARSSGHKCWLCKLDIAEKDLVVVKVKDFSGTGGTDFYHEECYKPVVSKGPSSPANHPETKAKQIARKPEFGGWASKADSKKRGYDKAYSAFPV